MTHDRQNAEAAIREATRIQRQAANPRPSVALRASAGSGKTRVLVDRFLRLCIEGDGQSAHPRSILAVTFTRKAAVEIQERLLHRAARMALAIPADLQAELADLFADRPDPTPTAAEMHRAGRLYEMVLEDVSGLNVGTIHSFCQLILNRFAVEAGLDPRFSVIEDPQELTDETLDQLELEIAANPYLVEAGRAVADNPTSLRLAITKFFHDQMRIQRWVDRVQPESDQPTCRVDALPLLLGDLAGFLFPEAEGESEPNADTLLPELRRAVEEFAAAGLDGVEASLDPDGMELLAKSLDKLRGEAATALAITDGFAAATTKLLLTQAGKLRSFTGIRKDPELKEHFQLLVARASLSVLDVLRRMKYVDLYEYNRGLLTLGLRALDLYDELKRRDRVVDFQDLENLARRLMGDDARALSLLYRLDDSISHILLDEFQDTNTNQWEILAPFVDEFLSGGSGESHPTVFFVGDVKQSIYEFRGAEPDLFQRAEQLLLDRDQPVLNLPTNFRSLGAVVGGVGCLFGQEPLIRFIDPIERPHLAQQWARIEARGRVVALPPYADEPTADPDSDLGRSGDQMAAEAAARIARHLVDGAQTTWDGFGDSLRERPLTWSDLLVLCRSRTEIGMYEKAFREAGIPIAPSGRGMLAASREVQDLLALLRWLVFPADDVALATVLRSPLMRITEADFHATLARRGLANFDADGNLLPPRGLWRTLVKDPDDPVTGAAVQWLQGWRKNLGFGGCHELLRRIYREAQVLERYQEALGDQARYNLLRLFDLSQGPELAANPTLRRLASLIEVAGRRGGQDEGTLPRGGDQGRVRFLTIHGSKGLEAPVVLLVDADRPGDKESARIRSQAADPDSAILFGVKKDARHPYQLPDGMELPADGLLLAAEQARLRGRREEAHLLYVALTRARDQLFVLGGDKERNRSADHEFDSPLRRIRRAAASGCTDLDPNEPDWLRDGAPAMPSPDKETSEAKGEAHRIWQPPTPRPLFEEVTPSGADSLPVPEPLTSPASSAHDGPDHAQPAIPATIRGEEIHALLQLAAEQGALPPGEGPFHDEAAAVFDDPELSWVLRLSSSEARGLCEVPIVHERKTLPGKPVQRITGIIDRLVLSPGRADIVDYKTNRTGGDLARRDAWAEHYAPQLELYREAVAALYPDRRIATWLLFTDPELDSSQRLVECTTHPGGK